MSSDFIATVTIFSDFRAQEEEICHYFHLFPLYLLWSNGARCHDLRCFFFLIYFNTGHLQTWRTHLSMSYLFVILYSSWGSHSKYTGVISHSLLQWIMFCQNSPLWPIHLGWQYMAWLIALSGYTSPFATTRQWSTARVQPRQDPGVPSGWTASARERRHVRPALIGPSPRGRERERERMTRRGCLQGLAESGNALFFTVAFIP